MMGFAYCVIMAGGRGRRFWPLSRADRPKQFIDILGNGTTMIQETLLRFEAVIPGENVFVVTGEQYEETVLRQLPALHPTQVLTESIRRNTAPAIAYASYRIYSQDPDAVVVVTPSDHYVGDYKLFTNVLTQAISYAREHPSLVVMGIPPTFPATGYGYIEVGEETEVAGVLRVNEFKEKPDEDRARAFLADGKHLWNSGIFVWHVKEIINALERHLPEVAVLFAELHDVYGTSREAVEVAKAFKAAPSISIDYGVMEHAENIVALKGNFGWDDLGTWRSLESFRKGANSPFGENIHLKDSPRTMVWSADKDKKVVAIGLEEYLIVDQDDILFIAPKGDEEELHKYIDQHCDLL
ncbi:MAG: mannose-1-phosphate guanylyltransferase [Porphyromonas sp.]|nr:mannose-1-phosphate guanylyltransferase [Porphyromonas sp.]